MSRRGPVCLSAGPAWIFPCDEEVTMAVTAGHRCDPMEVTPSVEMIIDKLAVAAGEPVASLWAIIDVVALIIAVPSPHKVVSLVYGHLGPRPRRTPAPAIKCSTDGHGG